MFRHELIIILLSRIFGFHMLEMDFLVKYELTLSIFRKLKLSLEVLYGELVCSTLTGYMYKLVDMENGEYF